MRVPRGSPHALISHFGSCPEFCHAASDGPEAFCAVCFHIMYTTMAAAGNDIKLYSWSVSLYLSVWFKSNSHNGFSLFGTNRATHKLIVLVTWQSSVEALIYYYFNKAVMAHWQSHYTCSWHMAMFSTPDECSLPIFGLIPSLGLQQLTVFIYAFLISHGLRFGALQDWIEQQVIKVTSLCH